jgi:hypothetical protein
MGDPASRFSLSEAAEMESSGGAVFSTFLLAGHARNTTVEVIPGICDGFGENQRDPDRLAYPEVRLQPDGRLYGDSTWVVGGTDAARKRPLRRSQKGMHWELPRCITLLLLVLSRSADHRQVT